MEQNEQESKQTWRQATKKDMIVSKLIDKIALNRADWKRRFILSAPKVWDKGFGVGGGGTYLKFWQKLEAVYFNLAFNKCNY